MDYLFWLFQMNKTEVLFLIIIMPTAEIKDYIVLIDLQPFYDIPIKNKEQTYKGINELFNHDNYTTGDSLTYEYFIRVINLLLLI